MIFGARTTGRELVSLAERPTGALDNKSTGCTEARIRGHCHGIGALDICEIQCLLRKIQTPYAGVFVYIAQNICKLKSTAKMMCECFSVRLIHAEDANAEPPDCRGNPVTIELELL